MCIQGFGTFTFSQRRIELGGNKHILIQRPVLVMTERLLQTHSLQYSKQHATGTYVCVYVCVCQYVSVCECVYVFVCLCVCVFVFLISCMYM